MKKKCITKDNFKEEKELQKSLLEFIKEKLVPEYFPDGITLRGLESFKSIFQPSKTFLKKAMEGFDPSEKVPLTHMREKVTQLDLDKLTGHQMLQLYEILSTLEGLEITEKVDYFERKELYEKVVLLEDEVMKTERTFVRG